MAESIWSDGVQLQNQSQKQILGRDQTASRWSAPSPGKRTRREEHALSHRPQMSSGRLFLDSGWSPPEPVSASPARTDYHALPACHLKTGTFYFAGKRNFLLCLDRIVQVRRENCVTIVGAQEASGRPARWRSQCVRPTAIPRPFSLGSRIGG